MPVWTWEEIVELWRECYSHRSTDDVVLLSTRLGGIVRWVLEHAKPKNLYKLGYAVQSMNLEELNKACRGTNDDGVHMLRVSLPKICRHTSPVLPRSNCRALNSLC